MSEKPRIYIFRSLSFLGEMYLEDGETEAGIKNNTKFYLASDVEKAIANCAGELGCKGYELQK
jgi:hypothetical protein